MTRAPIRRDAPATIAGEGNVQLYDADILTWSERQAALLRRRAAGELVNDAEIDWPNVAEEIEDVGSNRLHSVQSLLSQALRHILKAEAWPLSRDAPSWRADAIDFRQQAKRRFVPSMRDKIDVADLYDDALKALPETVDGQPPLPIQREVPTLDELLSRES
jgi:Domain of unknown function DUF29